MAQVVAGHFDTMDVSEPGAVQLTRQQFVEESQRVADLLNVTAPRTA